ncbi:MAG: hypothetical protein QM729_07380 [Solirubrobacterales bacterium]
MREAGRATRRIATVTLVGLLALTTVALAKQPHRAGNAWCGYSTAADWACGRHGVSWAGRDPLSIRTPRRLHGSATVATAEGGSARLTLGAEAHCTVGTGDAASRVVTRPETGVLLRQSSGDTSCGTPRRSEVELCTETGCNIQLEAEGVVLSSFRSEEATASEVVREEIMHHRVRIVSCSGFISVNSPGGSASGGANAQNRYVIEIDDYSFVRERENETVTPTEVTAEAEASAGAGSEIVQSAELPGRGACKAKFVREEERGLRS